MIQEKYNCRLSKQGVKNYMAVMMLSGYGQHGLPWGLINETSLIFTGTCLVELLP